MPGVPKSRGCEACRKQRKKCDQRQPSCLRCARLNIKCSGAGVQRFVFVDNFCTQDRLKQPRHASRGTARRVQTQTLNELSPNVQESMTALMVNKLSIKDLRYDVGWAFGPFVSDIPKRLGRSVALDSATQAFVLSLPPSPHTRRHPESDALESFTTALKATRLALAHPTESKSIDTLCAAYLLLICQDRMGAPEDIGVHIVGISHLLNNCGSDFDPCSGFDATLALVVCSVISAERFFDSKLEASASSPCWQFFNSHITPNMGPLKLDSPDFILEANLSRSLEKLSVFLHHVRPATEALLCFAGISSIIRDCRSHWQRSRKSLDWPPISSDVSALEDPNQEALRSHLRIVRSYGISLTLGLIMITVVRMYFPDQDDQLAQTSWKFSGELVSLAKQVTRFKPLGATFMAPFLNTVWAVGDHNSRTQMIPALSLHQVDFEVERATILSKRLNSLLDTMRSRILAQSSPTTGVTRTSQQNSRTGHV